MLEKPGLYVPAAGLTDCGSIARVPRDFARHMNAENRFISVEGVERKKTMKRTGIKTVLLCGAALLLAALMGTTANAQLLLPLEELGKSIFFDDNLSIERNQACAACHGPEVGWTGPLSDINEHGAVYEGSIPGRFGDRKPPSAAYATLSPIFHQDKKGLFVGGNFWDGRATGEVLGNPAADQALGPFLNPVEQALPDTACVVYRVCNPAVPGDYPVSFDDDLGRGGCDIAWPVDVEVDLRHEGETVALSDDDRAKVGHGLWQHRPVHRRLRGLARGERLHLQVRPDLRRQGQADQEEQKGFALFQGKGKCKLCHPGAARMHSSPTSPSTTWASRRTRRTRRSLPLISSTRAWAAS